MEKQKYKVLPMVRRMLQIMVQEDKKQPWRIFFYTVVAGIYPFMAVLLPKIAIGILEKRGADSVKPLILAMCGYFAAAGLLAFFSGRPLG